VSEIFQPTSRASTILLLVAVASAAFLVHSRSWYHPFVYDDVFAVRDHPVVRGDRPWLEVLTTPYWPRTFTPDPLYRPVTLATFRLNAEWFGLTARDFHIANSLLHACAACLVMLAAWIVWGRIAAGGIAGMLFAVHPVHAESVALIVGRSELLTLIFVLAMLIVHLRRSVSERRASVGYHVFLSILYALACLSKEHGVLAIVMIAAVDAWAWQRGGERHAPLRKHLNHLAASHYLGLVLVLAGVFFVRWLLFGWNRSLPAGVDNSAFNPLDDADTLHTLATPFKLLALSIQLMLLPLNLCPIWAKGGLDIAGSFLDVEVLTGVACAGIAVATIVRARRHTASVFLVGVVVFLLIPCHFVSAANWFFAERWLYTPTAMLLIAGSGVVCWWPRFATIAAAAIAVAFAAESWVYQTCWRNDESIVQAVVDRQPGNFVGLREMCRVLDIHDRLDRGAEYVARLVGRHPDEAATWYYQAKLWADQGRFDDARRALHRFYDLAQLPDIDGPVTELAHRLEQSERRP